MADKGDGTLRELHQKGGDYLSTYDKIRELKDISFAEWRILTEKYIPPKWKKIFTNNDGTGIIDIAQIKNRNLNKNDKFKRRFWMLADNGFCEKIRAEDQAVHRGFMVSDGIIRIAEGDIGE